MNANQSVPKKKMAYPLSMVGNRYRFLVHCPLEKNIRFTSRCNQARALTVCSGDIYILDDDEVVCETMGVTFESVPRKVVKASVSAAISTVRDRVGSHGY